MASCELISKNKNIVLWRPIFDVVQFVIVLWRDFLCENRSWASASRSMPPALAFRHPVSQSNTGAFRFQTESPYSGTGLVPASAFLFISVPDCLDAGQSDIPAFKKGTLCTSILLALVVVKGIPMQCTSKL
jgi:hypothetical protein